MRAFPGYCAARLPSTTACCLSRRYRLAGTIGRTGALILHKIGQAFNSKGDRLWHSTRASALVRVRSGCCLRRSRITASASLSGGRYCALLTPGDIAAATRFVPAFFFALSAWWLARRDAGGSILVPACPATIISTSSLPTAKRDIWRLYALTRHLLSYLSSRVSSLRWETLVWVAATLLGGGHFGDRYWALLRFRTSFPEHGRSGLRGRTHLSPPNSGRFAACIPFFLSVLLASISFSISHLRRMYATKAFCALSLAPFTSLCCGGGPCLGFRRAFVRRTVPTAAGAFRFILA